MELLVFPKIAPKTWWIYYSFWKNIKVKISFFLQRVNITSFQNCDVDPSENMDHFVQFSDISYECDADGFCDIVHAKFNIPTVNDKDKLVSESLVFCCRKLVNFLAPIPRWILRYGVARHRPPANAMKTMSISLKYCHANDFTEIWPGRGQWYPMEWRSTPNVVPML